MRTSDETRKEMFRYVGQYIYDRTNLKKGDIYRLILLAGLADLNKKEFEVLIFRFGYGMKLHEVAKYLDKRCTKENVRLIQNKALNKLREFLKYKGKLNYS